MTHALPPIRTEGSAANVGASVAAMFNKSKGAPPLAQTVARAVPVEEDDGWDPVLVAAPVKAPAPRAPRKLTLAEVLRDDASVIAEDEDGGWSAQAPSQVREVPRVSAQSLAAIAITKLQGPK